ncbi:sterol desaturase family protein [Maritalea myrionectae]|uniref:sterol desaturase family protein n=1 Tax=Maritalea myrionectae TaxID=454601 RepID=UPI000411FBFF|nr:sterol desaturase family protein [Maritalea myrionectae]
MPELGFNEGAWRFGTFAGILLLMIVLEAVWPRRKRRHTRLRRWATNFGILFSDYLAVTLVVLLVPVTAVITALFAQQYQIGLFYWLDWPLWVEWLIAFLVLDFVIWGQHVITHKIPILWRIHRVHHTDQDLDASSAVRFHPLEIILSIFIKSAAVLLLGAGAVLVVIFEAVVNGSALFNHANFKIPPKLDHMLRWFIVTPDMHRIHHSIERQEHDTNYGFALSIWDRLFRVYSVEPELGHDKMIIGQPDAQDTGPETFLWSILLPFFKRKMPASNAPPSDKNSQETT